MPPKKEDEFRTDDLEEQKSKRNDRMFQKVEDEKETERLEKVKKQRNG